MCNPVLWVQAALTIASIGSQVAGQNAANGASEDFQKAFAKANNTAAVGELSQLRIRQEQEHEASAVERLRAERETARNRSTAEVALGESGIGGNSVSAILKDYGVQEGLYKASLARQLQLTDMQIEAEGRAIHDITVADNINMNRSISSPDYIGAAAKIGAVGVQGYKDYQADKAAKALSAVKKEGP
jgi:hypothetical protein